MKFKFALLLSLFILFTFLLPNTAHAVDYYICSGDISVSSDIWDAWDGSSCSGLQGAIPSTGDTLTLKGSVVSSFDHTISYSLTIESGLTLTVSSGTLTNNGTIGMQSGGTLTIDNGSILTNNGALTIDNGILTNNGTLISDISGTWTKDSLGIITTGTTGSTTNNSTVSYSIFNNGVLPYSLAAQTANNATNYNAVLSHTPTSWSATGLPAGLSISTSTGLISGTPATTTSGTAYITSVGSGSVATQAIEFSVTDVLVPTIDIQGGPVSVSNNAPFTITFEFSESVTGFVVGDIVIVNATLSTFTTVDDNTFTVSVTPTGAGNITIDLPANRLTDLAGNNNTAASRVSITYSAAAAVTIGNSPGSFVAGGYQSFTPQFIQATPALPQDNSICTQILFTSIKLGQINNAEEVKRLQIFLNDFEKETLVVDGIYKQVDEGAVKRFQTKHASEILAPWGLAAATGYVHQTTRAKINLMSCSKQKGCPYFTQYHKLRAQGGDVKKIQNFLNLLFGVGTVEETGYFDISTFKAISRYQTFYRSTVLDPWSLKKSTGYWYQSTRLSANKLMNCSEGERILDNGVKI